MDSASEAYIGIMSGTSADAVDAVLIAFPGDRPQLLASHSSPLSDTLRQKILALCTPGADEIERLGELDRLMGIAFADAALDLLKHAATHPPVRAIGCHGQTLRHRPHTSPAFTLQVGDPNTIAERTGITTVADFRRRDIAAGGEGAPLVPGFHQQAFSLAGRARVIVNIGGMANISLLGADGSVRGFDTGPGNALMDAWIGRHGNQRQDTDGLWAARGSVTPRLLEALLSQPFFSIPAPKSTGRETFDLTWVDTVLAGLKGHAPSPEDVQATLLELTATSIAQAIRGEPCDAEAVYVCGGGAHNVRLMQRLAALLSPLPVHSTEVLGIAPGWVEAAAFAWLARRTLAALPGNIPAVTGASGARILGAIYQP